MIRLEQVSKSYPTGRGVVDALAPTDLEIPRGRFAALCGRSGSGKSTLLALVGGLATPSAGRLWVDHFEVSKSTAAERAAWRAHSIGFVFQMFHLLPYLNVLENVLAAAASGADDVEARAEAMLSRFGLKDRLRHRPGQLSAGERQRTAIARALINSPSLLLADEPTGNLDAENAEIVLDLIGEFHASGGTVLLATHDDRAAERAEQTLRMSAGVLAVEQSPTIDP